MQDIFKFLTRPTHSPSCANASAEQTQQTYNVNSFATDSGRQARQIKLISSIFKHDPAWNQICLWKRSYYLRFKIGQKAKNFALFKSRISRG